MKDQNEITSIKSIVIALILSVIANILLICYGPMLWGPTEEMRDLGRVHELVIAEKDLAIRKLQDEKRSSRETVDTVWQWHEETIQSWKKTYKMIQERHKAALENLDIEKNKLVVLLREQVKTLAVLLEVEKKKNDE